MKKRKILSRVIAAYLTVIMCSMLLVTAGATEEKGVGHLTFHVNPGGNSMTSLVKSDGSSIRGGYWLYHLADISTDETLFVTREKYKYYLGTYIESTYTPFNVLDSLYQENAFSPVLGKTQYSLRRFEPDYVVSIVDGKAEFTNLPDGLYYGISPSAIYSRTMYSPLPCIFCLPYMIRDNETATTDLLDTIQANVKFSDLSLTVRYSTETIPTSGGGASRPSTPTTPPPDNPPPDNPPDDPPPADNPPVSSSSINSVVCSGNIVKVVATGNDNEDYLFCAVYNDDGQMLDYRMSFIGGKERLQFEFASVEFSYAKAFMMDENGKPVCEGKTSIESTS